MWLARRVDGVFAYEWTAFADGVVATLGDWVRARRTSALYDQTDARILNRVWSGSLVAGVRLDVELAMTAGDSYAMDVRSPGQLLTGLALQSATGSVRTVMFAAPLAANAAPGKGDLVAIGRVNHVTEDVEIIDIDPQSDRTVSIKARNYIGPSIEAAETGLIPPLTTFLTLRDPVPQPRILGFTGSPDGVTVDFEIAAQRTQTVEGFSSQWRYTPQTGDASSWQALPLLGATARTLVLPPFPDVQHEIGDDSGIVTVDVRIRTNGAVGESSPWTEIDAIVLTQPVAPVEGFAVYGAVRTATDGHTYPVIAVSCTARPSGDATALVVEIQPADQTGAGWASAGSLPASNPVGDLTQGVVSATEYNVRARWQSASGWSGDYVYLPDIDVPDAALVATQIANQGALATLNAVDGVRLAAATGGNGLVDTDFNFITRYWCQNYDETGLAAPTAQVTFNGKNSAKRQITGTPAAGKEFAIGQGYGGHLITAQEDEVRLYALPCRPGDHIEASAFVSSAGLQRVNAEVYFWDATGTAIAPQEISPFVTDFTVYTSGGTGQAAMVRPGGFTSAPAHAAYCTLDIIGFTDGSANPYLIVQSPVLRIAQYGATELSAFTPGVGLQDADKTGDNVAAGISGQSPIATGTLTPAQVTNTAVPLGSNLVIDSTLQQGLSFFGPGYASLPANLISRQWHAAAYGNLVEAYFSPGLSNNAAGVFDIFMSDPYNAASLTDLQRFATTVNGGDRLYASVHALFGNGATGVGAHVWWWDVNGALLSEGDVAFGGRAANASFSGLNGDIDAWMDRVGGFTIAPATARFVTLGARVSYPAGLGGNDAHAAAARPFLAKVAADQTAAPPYVAGPTDRAANATGENTALTILNQSPIATGTTTAAQALNSNITIGNGNGFIDTEFVRGTKFWLLATDNSGCTGYYGVDFQNSGNNYYTSGLPTFYAALNGTPAAGTVWEIDPSDGSGNYQKYGVSAGERLYLSALIAYYRTSAPNLVLIAFDASGNRVAVVTVAITPTSALGGGVNMAGAALAQGVYDVPAGVAYVAVAIQTTSTGENNPYIFLAHPLLTKIPAGQTYGPAYTPGRTDPTADPTGSNTALNVVGQTALATATTVNLATQTSGSLGAAAVQYASGATVDSLKPAQAGADVTGQHTAPNVTNQGALATLNAADLGSQTTGNLAATRTIYSNGTNVDGLMPAEAGANQTGGHTALNVFNQTGWATFGASTNRLQYTDDTGRVISGNGLPWGVQTGVGATFSPQYPLHSDSPGLLQVDACSITLADGVVINSGSASTSTTPGGAFDVFYNLSSGGIDFVPNGTGQKASPNVYVFLGRLNVRNSDNTVPAPPAVAPGYGGGYGGGVYTVGSSREVD